MKFPTQKEALPIHLGSLAVASELALIARIHSFYQDENHIYIVSDLQRHGNLYQFMTS